MILFKFIFFSYVLVSYKRHYPTVTRQFGEFLYIRKDYVENNLFVKYYMRMANFNKVIKVLNIKFECDLLLTTARGAIETTHSIAKYYRMRCLDSAFLLQFYT